LQCVLAAGCCTQFDELFDYLTKEGKDVTKEQVMDLLLEVDMNEDVRRLPPHPRACARARACGAVTDVAVPPTHQRCVPLRTGFCRC
jgi:hypothetical protein